MPPELVPICQLPPTSSIVSGRWLVSRERNNANLRSLAVVFESHPSEAKTIAAAAGIVSPKAIVQITCRLVITFLPPGRCGPADQKILLLIHPLVSRVS